ncbi:MAG: YdcF family protein [Desulfurobacterium sp.]|nr:MAG: YdcF family protein [Desulfurobacterium sp.]
MFILSKLFTFLFLPPGIFVVLILIGIVLLLINKRKIGIVILTLTATLIYLLSIEPVKDRILLPLENAFPYPEAIVVLGGGKISHSPAEEMKAAVAPQVAKRLYTAFKVWKRIKKPLVVSGGKVFNEKAEPESSAMKRFLTNLGIPDREVIEDDRSRNTFQNGIFTYEILSKRGIKKICLVTSAYHMPRSYRIFKSAGFSVIPVPADYRVDRDSYNWSDYFPQMEDLYDSFLGIHEYVGIVYFELIQKRKLLKWRAREDSNLRPTD